MPIPVPDAVRESEGLATSKAAATRDVPRFLLAAVLAGAFVGIAIVLLFSVCGPLAAAGSPLTKLVSGSVFGLALTLVVFAGGELLTGNMMVMTQGAIGRASTWATALWVCALALVGNAVGSLLLAALVHGAGTLSTGPAAEMLGAAVAAKDALSGPQLFWRAVLCNMLVCLGLWMAARTRSDAAKLVVLWWALLAFIASGFEHSVANMTTFSIAALNGTGTWSMLGRNLLWTVPGNLVGGALVVGGAYAYLGRARTTVVVTPSIAETATVAPADDERTLIGSR
jgi:nitrite transporter NirC